METVTVGQLKKGDKVNGHFDGWLTVESVTVTGWLTTVKFSSASGEIEKQYISHTFIDIIRG